MRFTPFDHPLAYETPRHLSDITSWHGLIPIAFSLIAAHQPKVFVELGTHKGDSYCAFCQAVDQIGLDTHCFAIDTWRGDEHAGEYSSSILEDLRAYHDPLYGRFSRLIQSTFDDALPHFSDGSIDLLHIDGCHTYEAVKHDFETWLAKMSPRGIILFHDTRVRERGFGVWRLWEELRSKYPATREFGFSHGLGVLAVNGWPEGPIGAILTPDDDQWRMVERHFHALGNRIELIVANNTLLQRNRELDAQLNLAVTVAEEREAQIRQHVAERDGQIASLNQALAERDGQIASLNQALAERDRQVASFGRALSERDEQLKKILASRSWRLTKPLRVIGQVMRGE